MAYREIRKCTARVIRKCCLQEVRKMIYTNRGVKRLPMNFCVCVHFITLLFISDGEVEGTGALKIHMKSSMVDPLLL